MYEPPDLYQTFAHSGASICVGLDALKSASSIASPIALASRSQANSLPSRANTSRPCWSQSAHVAPGMGWSGPTAKSFTWSGLDWLLDIVRVSFLSGALLCCPETPSSHPNNLSRRSLTRSGSMLTWKLSGREPLFGIHIPVESSSLLFDKKTPPPSHPLAAQTARAVRYGGLLSAVQQGPMPVSSTGLTGFSCLRA